MTLNYYKLLQISETASAEEIKQAYTNNLAKWKQLQTQQPPEAKERTDKIIASIEQAYRTLSNPTTRADFDKSLNTQKQAITIPQQTQSRSLHLLLILILVLLITITGGVFYLIFNTTQSNNSQTNNTKAAESQQIDNKLLTQELEKADKLRKQNANKPELKEIAQGIATNSNKNANVILNANTQFLGAKSANQNITFHFMVIDGIVQSPSLLASYLRERFIIDNNDVCNNQQTEIAKGILFTFAYYNSKGNLLGSYYIDQQVCQSPNTNKILKKPDENMLKSVDVETNKTTTQPKDTTTKH